MQRTATPDVARCGKRLTLGAGDNTLTVLYLRGNAYERGYAHGKLCAEEVHYLHKSVAPLMLFGLGKKPAEVDQLWQGYVKYLRPEYVEELRGLADGAGLSYAEVCRMHAIPDLSEWHCTFFAATGPATKDGQVVQVRALDYETRVGIQKHPAVLIVQPDKGIPYANVTWLGHAGMVTGMNAEGIAMSEIGDEWDKGTDSFDGRPLTYVMRDAVQHCRTIADAVASVRDLPRTTSLLYCLSSAREQQVRALVTSHTQCKVYEPSTNPFPSKPGLVYLSMSMASPWNPKVGVCLLADYGRIDVETAQRLMREQKTGDLHAVVMRPHSGELFVSNASKTTKAYDRPAHRLNLRTALKDPFFGT